MKFFEQKGGVGSQNSEGFGANQATFPHGGARLAVLYGGPGWEG